MAKQYYAVVNETKMTIAGMSNKVATPKAAIGLLAKTKNTFSARPLGPNKVKAMEAYTEVKKEIDAIAGQHRAADIRAAEKEARETLRGLVSRFGATRVEFMEKAQAETDFANFFEWDPAKILIMHQYQANVAARVLRLAKEKPERHLFDWLFINIRHELKLSVEARGDGAHSFWRVAVRFAKAEARRDLLDGLSGLPLAVFRGQRCIEAREALDLPPPPWTKVHNSLVKVCFDAPGFERE